VTASDVAPGVTAPDNGDQTIGVVPMTVTKSRYVPIRWNGEEQLGVSTGGAGQVNSILSNQFAQAFRTLANEMEKDLGLLARSSSRAYGTAGTPPFASTLADPAELLKILLDNGAPRGDLQLVINTTAGAKLRTLAQLTKANEAGSSETLRRGVLLDIHGFMIRESAGVANLAQAAATGYVTNGVRIAGDTGIVVATGAAAISAGSVITFAADTANKYIVAENYAGGAGTLKIQEPGLRVGIPNGNAITVNATTYAANLGFDRNALQLLARVPAMPQGGDMADDVTIVVDPVSGIPFQVAVYRQYRQVKFEIAAAWGVAAVAPRHIATLLG
jgi:hypothetical protein